MSQCSKYIRPAVLMYGYETLTVTKTLARRLDVFDTWLLRKIVQVPYMPDMQPTSLLQRLPVALQFLFSCSRAHGGSPLSH